MTRKNWIKGLIAALLPISKVGGKNLDIWSTPKGIYVLALRKSLEELGCYEHCETYWKSIEKSLEKDYDSVFFVVHAFRLNPKYTYTIEAANPILIGARHSDGRPIPGEQLGAKVLNSKYNVIHWRF